jgi:hypothetical protein
MVPKIGDNLFLKSMGNLRPKEKYLARYSFCYDCHLGTDLRGEVKIDLRGTGLVVSKVSDRGGARIYCREE